MASEAILQHGPGLDVLGTIAIDGDLKSWSETTLFQRPFAFPDLVDQLAALGYDFVIFDLSPGISNLEKSILAVADEVIGVISTEFFSFDGLEIFESELEKLKRDRRAAFRQGKIIVNRVNKSFNLHKAYLTELEKLKYDFYFIGQNTAFSDCVPAHKTVIDFDPGNKYLPELQRLAGGL
jgi:cellulose biosynthesis protein BcsQ